MHDFNIRVFNYDDFEKKIIMKATSQHIKKEACFQFINVLFCEINGIEEYQIWPDILDWYVLPDDERFIDSQIKFKPIGVAFVKAAWDTIRIYCEKIEFEEKELSK